LKFTTNAKYKKAVAKNLKGWSDKVGHVASQLALAREVLQLEIAQDMRILTPLEDWLKRGRKKHTLVLSSLKHTIARLRSTVHWLKEGDVNMKLFHQYARYRKKKNFVAKLNSEGNSFTEHNDKAKLVHEYYSSLLGCCLDRSASINLDVLGIQADDLAVLDSPFTEHEIWEVIKGLPSDKAPGPDGFTGRF
jgi:hypothetical protein